jgi:hypothetical protein
LRARWRSRSLLMESTRTTSSTRSFDAGVLSDRSGRAASSSHGPGAS